MASGPFNQSFWQIDVPRAAAVYPAMWHAGVAFAALSLSMQNGAAAAPGARPMISRNYQYQLALMHFNKSIQKLSQQLTECRDHPTYADKEMAVMTNLLYIGIVGILDDVAQTSSHYQNLLRLLEAFKFGDEHPSERTGSLLAHEDLISLVLSLDGSFSHTGTGVQLRWDRSWVVKLPTYEVFTSITQAYLAFLPHVSYILLDRETVMGLPGDGVAKRAAWRSLTRRFGYCLDDYWLLRSASCTEEERLCVRIMQHYMETFKVADQTAAATCPADVIRGLKRYKPILDRLEKSLQATSRGSLSRSLYSLGKPYLYSPSYGSLLELLATRMHDAADRRRCIALMERYPYKERGTRSDEKAAFFEAVIQHEITGPARTRASQLAGQAVIPTYRHKDGSFDGTKECECVSEIFVCGDHRAIGYELDNESDPPNYSILSQYEQRVGMPTTQYFFRYRW